MVVKMKINTSLDQNMDDNKKKGQRIQALKDSNTTNLFLWPRAFLLGDGQDAQLVCYLLQIGWVLSPKKGW